MSARHLRVLALASIAAAGGCQPARPEPATRETSMSPTTAPAADASSMDAERLAKKSEEWAKMIEAMQEAKRNAATAPTTKAAASQPVAVETPPPAPTTAPAPADKPSSGTAAALVFTPPPATAPIIEVHGPAAASTQPAVAPKPVETKVVVKDELVERVRDGVKNAPRDPAANLDYQLVRFLRDEQSPDLTTLSSLPADDREAISALLDGLSNFRAGLRADPNGMTSKKVRPLVDMSDRLRASGDLQIPRVALCSTVKGYGLYEPIKTAFAEGRDNRALLYCEVVGFASHPGDGGEWETKLTQEVVLYRGETEVWKKGKVDQIVDRCRNKRHDFYLMNLIALPGSLPAGTYTLKVTVVDQFANRVAESTMPVTIVGGGGGGGNTAPTVAKETITPRPRTPAE